MYLLSAFGSGIWLIPVIFAVLAAWYGYQAYKASKVGSTKQLPGGKGKIELPPMQLKDIPQSWAAALCAVLAIAFIVIRALTFH